jgi:GntR family phosphonate transport system transcriptional regulator
MTDKSREFFMTETARKTLWHSIASTLLAEIGSGVYPKGGKLPTEAELSLRFGVNRHTVRAALAHMAEVGAVHARRGSGVFVAQDVADYRLGRRVRFHQNISALGRLPSRTITRTETLPASGEEAAALGLDRNASVHVVEGLSLADGQPIAMFRSAFPAQLDGFLTAVQKTGSITQSLAICGVADYARRETRITAHVADGLQSAALQIASGAALLRTAAVNVGSDGRAVEYGMTWFAADRVALVLGQEDMG